MYCEICKSETILDDHHIISRSNGGSNSKNNIAKICPNCHRKVHIGELIIEGRFVTTIGNKLIWRNKGEVSISGLPDPLVYLIGNKK